MLEAALPAAYALRYGSLEPLPDPVLLSAGPLTCAYEAGELRSIRWREHLLLLRLYAAIRDRNWGTVPGTLTLRDFARQRDSFRLVFESEHRQDDLHFVWRGTLQGTAEGALTFDFDGEARSAFLRNRIGFCLLHPASLKGQKVLVEHTDGSREQAVFPERIHPEQPVPPFSDLRAFFLPLPGNATAELRMEGDTFELEDQRNWTDASFKTFCTPLSLPYPAEVVSGTRVRQRILLRCPSGASGPPGAGPPGAGPLPGAGLPPGLRLEAPETGTRLPALGVLIGDFMLSAEETARLKRLSLSHLRYDIRFVEGDWKDRLMVTLPRIKEMAPLEMALYFNSDGPREAEVLLPLLRQEKPVIAAWLTLPSKEVYTGQPWLVPPVEALRGFAPDAPLGGGSDADFIFFNRLQGDPAGLDFVSCQINPQTHAVDNASLVETLGVLGEVAESARVKAGGLPVGISPLTLRPRFNWYATVPGPPSVPPDPRQKTLFGAAWTLGSLSALVAAGVSRVTLFEATGEGGVQGSAGVYPVWFVLAWLGEYRESEVFPLVASDPMKVAGLRLGSSGSRGSRTLVANLTNDLQTVQLPLASPAARVKVLDESNAIAASADPEAFLSASGSPRVSTDGLLTVVLPPFALACIEGEYPGED